MEKDRNLLFALTALQLEYIDFERYNLVCADWSANNNRPLSELLLDRNWLTAEQIEAVERRLEQEAHELDDGTRGVDSQQATSPITEDTLPGYNDEATLDGTDQSGPPSDLPASHFEATLDSSDQSASNLEATQDMYDEGAASEHTQDYGPGDAGYVHMETVDHADQSAGERSRYTFTKMHGEGGIGRVWLAKDQHLNRQIALKEIRPDKEQSKSAWKRFVREAQITSQLEHPNIIPVYELSSRSSEQGWFYTMRFVRGDTFRHAIDDYHRHRREGTATELELRSLLNSFVAVCHALDYAHTRGVLHRDLKPSNIMLGAFGEVVVLDWGLAKMVDSKDDDDLDLMTAGPVSVTAEGDIAATQQGSILGTLPYMAPEQAAGRLDKVDSRTDIYGLGAILYAILTGNHPHKGTTTREVRSRILNEPTPRVRHEEKSAHPVLDSICGKAMSKERSNRYAKAGLLAADVERWLADEPVSCHQESRVARAARWLRRNKTWAKSILAALLLVTTVSLVAAVLINGAKNRTERALKRESLALASEQQAKEREQKEKQIALDRFQETRKTVDEMMLGVNDALRDFPGMQPLRRRFLEEAARKYEGFVREDATATLQLAAASSLLRLGDIHLELDQSDDARKLYHDAATRLQGMIDGGAASDDIRLELVTAWTKLGTLASQLGDQEEAMSFYELATEILAEAEEPAETNPNGDPDGRFQFARAGLLVNRAGLLSRSGDSVQAITLLQEAITQFGSLVDAHADARFVDGLAMARNNLGGALRKQGRNSDAIVHLEAAAEAYRQLSQSNPEHPRYLVRAAATRLNLAAAFRTLGRDREEQQAYRNVLADYELLVSDRSDVPLYQERRALTKIDLALVLHAVGENREASQLLTEAIAETQHLLDTRLGLMAYYEQLALGRAVLGRVFADLGDEQAAIFLETALDGYEELIEADPGFAPSYRSQRAATRTALGLLYRRANETAAARTTLKLVAEEFESLLESDPNNDSLKHVLAWSYTHQGDLEWAAGQEPAASDHYRKAFSLRESLDREPEHRYAFAKLLIGCSDPNVVDADRAAKLAAELVEEAPQNPRYATLLGAAQYRAGNLEDAIPQLTSVDDLSPQGGAAYEFWLVLALAKKGGEQNLIRAKNRLESAVVRMELDTPARPELVRLRAEAEAALAPPAEAADPEKGGDE